ncbi:T9SS type A sorting domain-containing protein [Flavobacterium succinicans]|nr:T9SS type A sorting domain-containing protein [Flavobacterium succinicans]
MKKLLLFFLALVTMATHSQTAGDIAQSYGVPGTGFNGEVRTTKIQADGKIIVGGAFTTYNGVSVNKIIRLNTNGTIDTSFDTGTGFNNEVRTTKIQADGKILVGGFFTTYKGVTQNYIIRLNNDGSKDTTFNIGTGFDFIVFSIEQQTDGKILVGGNFNNYNGVTANRIIRLNSDGSKDTSFTTGTGFGNVVHNIALQANGKILVGGYFSTYNEITENGIIRLNSDGTKDTTFNIGAGFTNAAYTDKVYKIFPQTDGKILVGGNFTTYNGVTENNIIRLNSDGSKDTSFTTGTGFDGYVYDIALQANSKILVGGLFTNYQGITEKSIIRLNTDGSKDTSFTSGTGFGNSVNSIELQTDGKILASGGFTSYNGVAEKRIIRLNTDGTNDTTFNNGQFDNIIRTTEEQTDGKILVGGLFTSFKGSTENRIIRLNTDGSKDTNFNTGTGFDGTVYTIKKQTDGKIIVGGNFTTYKGVAQNYLIRLNTDGTKDASFDIGTGFNASVRSVKILDNGKILVGGTFTNYLGVTANKLILLNADGTKDTSFNTGTGFNSDVYTMAQQTDGKILVGGNFYWYNGTYSPNIIRLNADGTIDPLFNIGSGFDWYIATIEVQANGKILVGGQFGTYNGVSENRIIRLNTDGSKDTTFNNVINFTTGVLTTKQQANGKILVGGQFGTYYGGTENRIVCLNTDGTKDIAFINGTGFNDAVFSIQELSDGKILVGGNFTTYKGDTSSAYLIKLHTEASISNTAILTQIGKEGDAPNKVISTVTTAQLGQILPAITDIVAANEAAYQAYIDANPALFASPATVAEVQAMVTAVNAEVVAQAASTAVLTQIGNEGDAPNTVTSAVTTAQLGQILPAITDIVAANEAAYQAYIDANPALFASPATVAEVQAMVTAVNAEVVAQAASTAVLTQIGNEGDAPNTVTSTVTTAQLGQILPAITDIVAANEAAYQAYIDANPALFASPATVAEVQAMVTAVNAVLSTGNFDVTTKLVVYPNPSDAIFNIEIDQNASLELFDIIGKQLKSSEINLGTSQIDLTNYNSGVYFLIITNETNQTKTVRLIKQ